MLALVALAYWLLCLRLQVCIEASLYDWHGNVSLRVGAYGISLRYDTEIWLAEKPSLVHAKPRYPSVQRKRTKWQKHIRRFLRSHLRSIITERRFERIVIHARVGMGDAAETAIACGALQTVLYTLFMPTDGGCCDLRIIPDYSCACLCAMAQGIFSCQPGDIILAALQDARRKQKKTGKEGFNWKSILLRA